METKKITPVSITEKKTGTTAQGKPYTIYEVTDSDGNKYDSFEKLTTNVEIEVEFTPNKNPQYNGSIKPKTEKKPFSGGFGAKAFDKDFEAKKHALQMAVETVKLTGLPLSSGDVLTVSKFFESYLKGGENAQ